MVHELLSNGGRGTFSLTNGLVLWLQNGGGARRKKIIIEDLKDTSRMRPQGTGAGAVSHLEGLEEKVNLQTL